MSDRATQFRRLHAATDPLLLPNAWDAGSARLIESCGAKAIATTSAGVAWSRGYPDGNALPPRVLAAAVGDITRVIAVPLTVDVEGGYSDDPKVVAENVAVMLGVGAVGINIEDGAALPDLLCAKIAAVKDAAARAGVDVFVNARTDVFLRGLVAAEQRATETIERARRYRAAGCDGLFVPGLADVAGIRAVVAATDLPLNVMVLPTLPPVSDLRALGVRRVSAGSAIAQTAYGIAREAAIRFLDAGVYDAMGPSTAATYGEMNALFMRS